MAKVLCILAWASTLSAAPTSDPYYGSRGVTNSLANNADSLVVDSVLRSLSPSLDAAIEAAMRGLSTPVTSFTGTVSRGPTVSVQHSGSSRGENSQSKWSSQSTSSSKGSRFQATSGFGGSGLGSTSNFGSLSGLGASSGLGSSGFGSSFGTGSTGISSSQSSSSSEQGKVVEAVLAQLNPSIIASIQGALSQSQGASGQQFQQNQQAQKFQQNQQAQQFQQNQEAQFSSSSSQSAASETELVGQIIEALSPSITQSVEAALSGQSMTSVITITQQQQAQAAAAAAQ